MSKDIPRMEDYATLPIKDTAGTVALAESLLAAAPKARAALVGKVLDHMSLKLLALRKVWKPKPVEKRMTPQQADLWNDHTWSASYDRLKPYLKLHCTDHPLVAKAKRLIERLFPKGATFLTLTYEEQWAESRERMEMIETQDGMANDFEKVIGPLFLAQLRRAHPAYGKTLGTTKAKPEQIRLGVLKERRDLHTAMKKYIHKLIGHMNEDDKESVKAVKAALVPIDEARAKS